MAVVNHGATRTFIGDARGAVYVEFLLALFPLFLLFFAVCQLALLSAAKLVVQHAATRAARTAIVALDDEPARYGDAPRNVLSAGRPKAKLAELLFARLGAKQKSAPPVGARAFLGVDAVTQLFGSGPQRGARMAPIRLAAYVPLAVLAPSPRSEDSTLSAGLRGRGPAHALAYNQAASVVTVHDSPDAEALAAEPIERNGNVTVRVTYLYSCSIPIIRNLLCSSLDDLKGSRGGRGVFAFLRQTTSLSAAQRALSARLSLAESPEALTGLVGKGARFAVIVAQSTLPNHGAAYAYAEREP